MPKAQADEKKAAMKAAEKKMAANGVTKPRHGVLTSKTPPMKFSAPIDRSAFPANPYQSGVDTNPRGVVHSNQAANPDGPDPQTSEGTTMNTQVNTQAPGTDGVAKAAAIKAEKEAIKAKAKTERDAKAQAAKDAKAADLAKKVEAAKEAKAKKEQERTDKKAAADAARVANPKAPRERTYVGSMLSLSERVASGVYVKGVNGQLRSADEVAIALESIPAPKMVDFLVKFLGLPANPYAHLNYGQQSMNLRNKLRGALKAGTKAGEGETAVILTLDLLKAKRDEGNWTAPIPKVTPTPAQAAA